MSHGKGRVETQHTQEIKQLEKVILQCEGYILKTTLFLNVAIFTIAPQNVTGQIKYYFLQLQYDENTMGREKKSRKVLQNKANNPLLSKESMRNRFAKAVDLDFQL